MEMSFISDLEGPGMRPWKGGEAGKRDGDVGLGWLCFPRVGGGGGGDVGGEKEPRQQITGWKYCKGKSSSWWVASKFWHWCMTNYEDRLIKTTNLIKSMHGCDFWSREKWHESHFVMYSINFGHQNPEHIRVLHSKGKKLNQPKEVEEERHTQKLSKQIGLVCIFPNL